INISQFVAYSLRPLDSLLFRRWCQHTERYFTLVLIHLTQWLAPTTLVLTHDTSIPATGPDALPPCAVLDGTVARLNLAPRAIVIANHQVYMDWIYLWFVAYYAGCHGYVKIILKDSLRSIPIFGWGMQFFRFIFLRRNWEADRRSFTEQIRETAQDALPYWLTLFPEGTTISQKALNKSSAFGIAQGYAATQHVLLPRSTGLFHVCQGLRESSDYLYDITMGCEGLRADQVPQETYTIPRMFLERFYPRLIHIHVRRVPMGDVPTESEAFAQWLQQRWYEKDRLMAYFYRCGHFP
ncbi:acyltransferase-domain-containing protein, partial [Dimargaris cristalligena]